MEASKRLSKLVIGRLRTEIAAAEGNEIFALGRMNDAGLVIEIEIVARGNESAVLAPQSSTGGNLSQSIPDVMIHNHPSGVLRPSDNDLSIASRAAQDGVGSYIIDNQVREVYAIVEPIRIKKQKALDGALRSALEEGGSIAQKLPTFELRPTQVALMDLIIRCFNEDALGAAEAGTGVGKSFAYLLPAMTWALENEERIILSTATINLQQQLFEKDIPLVASTLKKPVKAVLVKGRGNYLCRRRLEENLREPSFIDEEVQWMETFAAWSDTTKTGSISDLPTMPPDSVWSQVCSEGDLCMGMACPQREGCFVMALRRECADASIVVVNHHLLFADLSARHEAGEYEHTLVLPPYRRIVIDEAHKIEDSATSFFSKTFSKYSLQRQLGRLHRRRQANESGLLLRLAGILDISADFFKLQAIFGEIERIRTQGEALDAAALLCCQDEGTFRFTPSRESRAGDAVLPQFAELRRMILRLLDLVRDLLEAVPEDVDDDSLIWEIKAILRRLDAIATLCQSFMEYRETEDEILWVEQRRSSSTGGREPSENRWIQFTATPLEVAPSLRKALFEPHKTVLCLSATLTVQGGPGDTTGPNAGSAAFSYWMNRTGLDLVKERTILLGQFPSPFPYETSVLFGIPRDAPSPDNQHYQGFVDAAVAQLAELAGGSALILFTSYQALRSAYAYGKPLLEAAGIRCLKQGDDDRTRLLQTFLGDKTSVLFATDSFWEGVDAPGDTLQLVILCRLPFRSPRDPVFEARCEALKLRGLNPFMELSLPESVMKFKQGFGRLIRRSSDRGVVVSLDNRLLHTRYGSFFINSIPQTRSSYRDFEGLLGDVEDFLYGR